MKNSPQPDPSAFDTENHLDPFGPRFLTESQARAHRELAAIAELAGHHHPYGGVIAALSRHHDAAVRWLAGILGFIGIAGLAAEIAKVLFFIFLVLFVVSLIAGRRLPV
jgi:uncharacterized membrane protein YtjA (UPF0391 family)